MGGAGIPTRDRGQEYKVQWYRDEKMSWFDIQKRYPNKATATAAAREYGQKHKVRTRLMEIDNNTGKRTPIEL